MRWENIKLFMRKEFDQPSSLEAEKAVLGGLLLKPDLWDTVSVTVDEKDFILLEHQLIYRAIRRLSCLLYTSPSPRDDR